MAQRRGGDKVTKSGRGKRYRRVKNGVIIHARRKSWLILGFDLESEGHPGGYPRCPRVSETGMS